MALGTHFARADTAFATTSPTDSQKASTAVTNGSSPIHCPRFGKVGIDDRANVPRTQNDEIPQIVKLHLQRVGPRFQKFRSYVADLALPLDQCSYEVLSDFRADQELMHWVHQLC